MIRVTFELISARDGRRETLGIMDICNVSRTGIDSKRGDYFGSLYKKGTQPPERPVRCGVAIRAGEVYNYPRLSYPVWRLVLKMLKNMYPEEK